MSVQASTSASKSTRPSLRTSQSQQRSIRAHYDEDTITLYQAYNATIADAAVSAQNLAASATFSTSRTTWIKPSWSWMMYRSGYSYKDVNQARILALKMRHADFETLLSMSRIAGEDRSIGDVVVQWDPERSVRIGRIDGGAKNGPASVRSIQIGISGKLVRQWVDEWIVSIEDVTERARELKRSLDESGDGKDGVTVEELIERGLVPVERVYDEMLSVDVRKRLRMEVDGDGGEK